MNKLSDIENNCTVIGESAGWLHDFSKEVQFSACQTILNKIKHFSLKTNELQLFFKCHFFLKFYLEKLAPPTFIWISGWIDGRIENLDNFPLCLPTPHFEFLPDQKKWRHSLRMTFIQKG